MRQKKHNLTELRCKDTAFFRNCQIFGEKSAFSYAFLYISVWPPAEIKLIFKIIRQSEETIALRERRNNEIRAMHDELIKNPELTRAEIFERLSDHFYLGKSRLYTIIDSK